MPTTDPYGALEFAIGSPDDFWCFDYDREGRWGAQVGGSTAIAGGRTAGGTR